MRGRHLITVFFFVPNSVSGLSPFAGEDDIQTMANITIGRYDFLDEAFDTVSEEAIDFINRCLVKEQK